MQLEAVGKVWLPPEGKEAADGSDRGGRKRSAPESNTDEEHKVRLRRLIDSRGVESRSVHASTALEEGSLETEERRRSSSDGRRLSKEDFAPLALIGRGAFGEVRLCKMRQTNEIYALKTIRKSAMKQAGKVVHVRAERDCMAEADNPWIVKLHYSFQDTASLYLAMEFLPGGDLMQLLCNCQRLPELDARFYFCETACAIQAVHKMGFIHRDLKPDNILLDHRGHVKLTDLGLACRMKGANPAAEKAEERSRSLTNPREGPVSLFDPMSHCRRLKGAPFHRDRLLAYSIVGTPDFIAPEVLDPTEGYGYECDWWSLGVILYECLVGFTPFYAETTKETRDRILKRRAHAVPGEISAELSDHCKALLESLIRLREKRLGRQSGLQEIKQHPWCSDVDFDNLRNIVAPNIPSNSKVTPFILEELRKVDIETSSSYLRTLTDTLLSNFDSMEDGENMSGLDRPVEGRPSGQDSDFEGFSFKRKPLNWPLEGAEHSTEGASILSWPSADDDTDFGAGGLSGSRSFGALEDATSQRTAKSSWFTWMNTKPGAAVPSWLGWNNENEENASSLSTRSRSLEVLDDAACQSSAATSWLNWMNTKPVRLSGLKPETLLSTWSTVFRTRKYGSDLNLASPASPASLSRSASAGNLLAATTIPAS